MINRVATLVVLVLSACRGAFAQTVRGTVRDNVSGAPVAGAVVSALDSAGNVSARTLTDQAGRFVLTGSGHAHRLQILHIGHLPTTVPIPAAGADGVATVDVRPSAVPLLLTTVRSSGTAVCPPPEDKGVGFALWDQARAEFLAAVVARDAATGGVRLLSYDRDLDPQTGLVTRQATAIQIGQTTNPVVAARSPAAFATRGYIDSDSKRSQFYGPDAYVLLDDGFAANHCFETTRGRDEHAADVGIAFTPAHVVRNFADIAGVLWIDSTTRSIRSLEYRYTGVDPTGTGARSAVRRWALGGVLTFRTLPSGIPLIERWVIRTSPFAWSLLPQNSVDPAILDAPASGTATGESGAELLEAAWPGGVSWHAPLGTAVGRVHAAGSGVLDHPAVWLDGTNYFAPTDSGKAFRITEVLPGRYSIGAADGILAPFGISQMHGLNVSLMRDSILRVDVALTDTPAEAVAKVCHKKPPTGHGDLVIRGLTVDGAAMPDMSVDVFKTPGHGGGEHEASDTVVHATRVNDRGTFIACGVALDADLRVRLRTGSAATEIHTRIPPAQPLDTMTLRIAGGG